MEKKYDAREALPMVAMIAVELAGICLATISKAAMSSGLNQYVFIVYYDALGTFILLPWFLSRYLAGKIPPITLPLLCRFFGLSLIGKCLFPICLYSGLRYSSIAVTAAIGNLVPIFTSLFAVCFRMEKLNLGVLRGQIKAFGMVVAVLGALIVTLYKGPALLRPRHSSDSLPHPLLSESPDWVFGSLLITLAHLLASFWSILQTDTAKSFPDEVGIIFFSTLFGTIQNAVASVFLVEGESAWRLHHQIDYVAVFYAAFSTSLFILIVITWCLQEKGPVYVSMFSPLKVALAGVIGFVFLKDVIYLGSVVGSATIVVGFYAVMWAQANARTIRSDVSKIGGLDSGSSRVTAPLLQSSHTLEPLISLNI